MVAVELVPWAGGFASVLIREDQSIDGEEEEDAVEGGRLPSGFADSLLLFEVPWRRLFNRRISWNNGALSGENSFKRRKKFISIFKKISELENCIYMIVVVRLSRIHIGRINNNVIIECVTRVYITATAVVGVCVARSGF